MITSTRPSCPQRTRHRWTSAGMGGCSENPGVWSLGGTAYATAERCAHCGTVRNTYIPGSQERAQGKRMRVTYLPAPSRALAR